MKARRDLWKVPDRRSTEDGKEPDELVVWAEGTGHPAFSLQAAGAMASRGLFPAPWHQWTRPPIGKASLQLALGPQTRAR